MFASAYSNWVVSQFSLAVIAAIPASHPRHRILGDVLSKLAEWNSRPSWLKTESYEWCSVICEEYQDLGVVRQLLLDSLRIAGLRGGRHPGRPIESAYTERHRHIANAIFNSGDDELIRGLLLALVGVGEDHDIPRLLGKLPSDLICLWLDDSTSPEPVRQLVIRSVECLGPWEGDRVKEKEFTALLDRLRVRVEDMVSKERWLKLLLRVVRSSQGRHDLPHLYWELIVELAVEVALGHPVGDDLQVMTLLEEEKEWEKLEYWSGYLWLQWLPSFDGDIPRVLGPTTRSLFRNRLGAVQKLEQWVERSRWDVQRSELLRSIMKRGKAPKWFRSRTDREFVSVVTSETLIQRQTSRSTSSAGVESEVPAL